MEDEIDLRPYIDSLRRKWSLIAGVAIGFGILGFIISQLIAPKYQAKTLILVKSGDIVQFDERFRDPSESQPLRNLPELATSDTVFQTVLTQIPIDNINHVEQLRQILKVIPGSDASTIHLTATYQDPAIAAQLASIWSHAFVQRANDIYYDYDGGQLSFYESQLIEAESRLVNAEDALIAFQSLNRGQVISNSLQAYSQRQIDYLEAQANLSLLQQDTQALLDTLSAPSAGSSTSFAEQFMALSLQLRFMNSDSAAPILLQPTESTTLTTESRTEQVAILENMLDTLESQTLTVNQELAEIEPVILDLQQQLQIAITEYQRLTRELANAQDTYGALARRVEEEKITSRNTGEGVTLASEPAVPNKPISPNVISNIMIGVLLGFVLALFGVISNQWWQIYNQSQ